MADAAADGEMKKAYGEMLAGCEGHPAGRLWYTAWKVCLKDNDEIAGDMCFKGAQTDGAVEIGYGINPGYEGKGFATEAAKALTEWAFLQQGVYFIEAETAPDNKASGRVLEKLGFALCGEGEEGPRFLLEKPVSAMVSVYISIGMCLGISIGVSIGKLAAGMCIGLSAGLCMGLLTDAGDKKKRAELKAKHGYSGK